MLGSVDSRLTTEHLGGHAGRLVAIQGRSNRPCGRRRACCCLRGHAYWKCLPVISIKIHSLGNIAYMLPLPDPVGSALRRRVSARCRRRFARRLRGDRACGCARSSRAWAIRASPAACRDPCPEPAASRPWRRGYGCQSGDLSLASSFSSDGQLVTGARKCKGSDLFVSGPALGNAW